MRRACSAFVVLLAVCAAPSAEAIQHVLTPFHDALLEQQNLDHAVPIADNPRLMLHPGNFRSAPRLQ